MSHARRRGAALVFGCDGDARPPGAATTAAPSAPPEELSVLDFDPGA